MSTRQPTRVRLDRFDPSFGLDRGASRIVEAAWYLIKVGFFLSALPWPTTFKVWLLRGFGANVGKGVLIKPRVNIHMPWKLGVGDHCWIGEEVFILNFEPVTIGNHVVISQRAFLCTGNHDFRSPEMPYRNRPITIEDGAWIGANVFVGPDVTVEREAVAAAGSVVTGDLSAGTVYAGNPATPRSRRFPDGTNDA